MEARHGAFRSELPPFWARQGEAAYGCLSALAACSGIPLKHWLHVRNLGLLDEPAGAARELRLGAACAGLPRSARFRRLLDRLERLQELPLYDSMICEIRVFLAQAQPPP